MLRFVLRRVLLGIPVLVTVATITFLIMHWVPGGPFDTEKILPPEIIANIEAKYHLDKPVPIQYLLYMKQLLQGDLGPSYKYLGRDVSDIIRDTLSRFFYFRALRCCGCFRAGCACWDDFGVLAKLFARPVCSTCSGDGDICSKFCVGGNMRMDLLTSLALAPPCFMGGAAPYDFTGVRAGSRFFRLRCPADPNLGSRCVVLGLYPNCTGQGPDGTGGHVQTCFDKFHLSNWYL